MDLSDEGSTRSLSMGCLFSDRIEASLDGRGGVEGYRLRISLQESHRLSRSLLREAQFDVGELSPRILPPPFAGSPAARHPTSRERSCSSMAACRLRCGGRNCRPNSGEVQGRYERV